MKNRTTRSAKNSRKASSRRIFYGDQSRRMTSITRKLHFRLIRRKLGIFLFSDVLLFLLSWAAFLFGAEYSRFSTIRSLQDCDRTLLLGADDRRLWYTVADKTGRVLLRKDVSLFFVVSAAVVGSILILQLLGLLFRYYGENKRIRKILSPINEIALRADELSRMSFSEDKYQVLEEAIEHIRPGDNESQALSIALSSASSIFS